MKKLIYTIIAMTILTTSCQQKKWRYEIRKEITVNGKNYEAHWYTDSIIITDTQIQYQNSDGTKVTIKPPYILKDNLTK